ncbi:MAG: hypothetical protein CK424_00710 [Legionella sp.]|nr:MAG: hypothetical protein CK424_00710 [Legionella sp.]
MSTRTTPSHNHMPPPSLDDSFVTESDVSVFDAPTDAYNNGLKFDEQENHEKAIECFSDSLEKLREILAEAEVHNDDTLQQELYPEIAKVLNYLGESYRKQGHESEAINCFQQAFKQYSDFDEEDTTECGAERHYHLGLNYDAQKNHEMALHHFIEALPMYQSIDTEGPWLTKIASIFQRLGLVYEALGNLADAKTCFTNALKNCRTIFSQNMNHPQLLAAKSSLERVNRKIQEATPVAIVASNVNDAVPVKEAAKPVSRPASPSCCGLFGGSKSKEVSRTSVENPINAKSSYEPPIVR